MQQWDVRVHNNAVLEGKCVQRRVNNRETFSNDIKKTEIGVVREYVFVKVIS